jgi:hypothetical protein
VIGFIRAKVHRSLIAKGWVKQGSPEALLLADDTVAERSGNWDVDVRKDLELLASATENQDALAAVTKLTSALKRWDEIHSDMRGSHRGRDRHAISAIAKLCRQVHDDKDLAADERAIALVTTGILRVVDLLAGSGNAIENHRLSSFTASVRALETQLLLEA